MRLSHGHRPFVSIDPFRVSPRNSLRLVYHCCFSYNIEMDKTSEHAIRVLEYDSLLKLLESYAKTSNAKRHILCLSPSTDMNQIRMRIAETSELKDLITSGNILPLGSTEDITPLIKNHASTGVSLDPSQLLSVASTLQLINDIQNYSYTNRDIAPILWKSAINL